MSMSVPIKIIYIYIHEVMLGGLVTLRENRTCLSREKREVLYINCNVGQQTLQFCHVPLYVCHITKSSLLIYMYTEHLV